ncbi:hypothetical protein CCS01_32090 [Rhodopila globiformis]|uniref:Uncharacterized protein n=1 Tax=Rhodopila globiformis TaxID=1071 RepID=A0A2S6MTP1_RHOGL|nr:hypothetical protein CCS01_32090 [Rhodopila globiformis]
MAVQLPDLGSTVMAATRDKPGHRLRAAIYALRCCTPAKAWMVGLRPIGVKIAWRRHDACHSVMVRLVRATYSSTVPRQVARTSRAMTRRQQPAPF